MCIPVYVSICRWFFHARNDNVVSVQDTIKLVDQLRKEGSGAKGHVKSEGSDDMLQCTIFEDGYKRGDDGLSQESFEWMVDHNCWDIAYNHTPELWEWLFAR
mgnify:FL=1